MMDRQVPASARQLSQRLFDHLGPDVRRQAAAEAWSLAVKVEAGWHPIGSTLLERGDPARFSDELDRQEHEIEAPFWIMAVPVTYGLYHLFQPHHLRWGLFSPGGPREDAHPVADITWWEASLFSRWIGGRLPTEYEWEVACRAGSTTRHASGDLDEDLDRIAWSARNSGGYSHPVAQLAPNTWGLFDMAGNVWEWCANETRSGNYHRRHFMRGEERRAYRGGSYKSSVLSCRSSIRDGAPPSSHADILGFRVVFDEPPSGLREQDAGTAAKSLARAREAATHPASAPSGAARAGGAVSAASARTESRRGGAGHREPEAAVRLRAGVHGSPTPE